jgi:retinol-binding protein 3
MRLYATTHHRQLPFSIGRPYYKLKVAFLIFPLLFTLIAYGQTTIPDTAAGKVLRAWLDAFNSGDRAKIETYIKTFDPQQSAERMLGFRDQTGGFDLLTIDNSEPSLIKFRVKEKAGTTVAIGTIQLKDAQSGVVETFSLRAIPPNAVIESVSPAGLIWRAKDSSAIMGHH